MLLLLCHAMFFEIKQAKIAVGKVGNVCKK